jgi:RHS repeat-associated protein
VAANQQTRVTYYDTGAVRTIDYPDRRVTTFDYTAQGWQSSRKPAGGPEETWTYYDDGELKENTDPNGHPNRFSYDLDNNLIRTDDATGVDVPTEAPLVVEQDYSGFDEPIQIRQRKEPPGQTPPPWRVTDYAYDANGNLQQRIDEGGTQTFGYDQADRFTSQLDANGSGCGDDRQLTLSYLRNGWQAGEVIRTSDGGCDASTWPIKLQTARTYLSSGDLQTLQSWKGAQTDANLIESHALEYESGGVYLNGNRAKDTFTLQGPGTASCRTSSCAATFGYDARERLTQWANGLPGADAATTTYTLDPDTAGVDTLEGDVVREVVTGAGARTRDYTYNRAGQVQTLSVDGTLTQRYFWDKKSGNIGCVSEPTYTDDTCTATAGLRDWYKFDPLDRLKVFKSFRSQDTIDSSYIYDAFDRVSSETESHNGGTAQTSDFTYLGISEDVSSETQRGSSASKRFSYDVDGARIGATITTSGTQDYSFARDPHGDTSVLVDDAGSLRASYAYKPYGNLDLSLSRGDKDPMDTYNPFRFNDKRFDSGSRSIDMGARRYEPDDGRFLQQDFLRDASEEFELSLDSANENRYAFAGGNPVTFVEDDGHAFLPDGGGGVRRTCPFKPVTYPTPRQRIKYSYSFFRSKGLLPVQCAAIIGNFWAETTVHPLNPAQGEIGGGGGVGIAQWTDLTRKRRLNNYARNPLLLVEEPPPSARLRMEQRIGR